MAQGLVEKIGAGLSTFSSAERRIAHCLLASYPVSGLQTATDLARAVGVSTPSVLRLVAKLGFASYMDFQRILRDELLEQLSSPLNKYPAPTAAALTASAQTQPAIPITAIDEFANAVLRNIQETFAHQTHAEFFGAAHLLSDPRARIHLIGGRFTDALARYLSVQLRILRPNVRHLGEQEANWRDQMLDMDKRDILVVFDIRRYQASLLQLSAAAAARKVRIVLLTDQWLSPILRHATHVLSAHVAVPSMWDSSAALMALSEALLAEVSRRCGEASRKRIRELEQM